MVGGIVNFNVTVHDVIPEENEKLLLNTVRLVTEYFDKNPEAVYVELRTTNDDGTKETYRVTNPRLTHILPSVDWALHRHKAKYVERTVEVKTK